MAAQQSGLGFGRFLAGSDQRFFVGFELGFNFRTASLGFAITSAYADGPTQGFKRQTAFPNGFHDRASGYTPADADFLEVIDHLFLRTQSVIPL